MSQDDVAPPRRGRGSGVAPAPAHPEPRRGLSHHPGRPGQLVAQGAGVRRSRLSGRGRLHGPRQLGHRPRRRRAVRLHAAERDPDLEPDGDPAPGARGQARHRDRARPGAGVPRPLLAAGIVRPLDPLRNRDRRLRPGRGDRLGDRAQPAVRHPAGLGRRDHGARRAAGALPPEQGLPAARGARHRADRHDRRLLPVRDCRSRVPTGARCSRVRAQHLDPRGSGTCSTSPSASSAPP